MKKFIFASAVIIAAAMTSCSNDEPAAAPAGDGNVTFTAGIPALASRAFADGTKATTLNYYVYDAEAAGGTVTPLITGTETFANLQATVNLNLVTGKTYDIVFWAPNEGAPYTYDPATQSVTVDYTADAAANNESRDAFFCSVTGLKVDAPVNRSITLNRPFAQVNIGTSDIEDARKGGFDLSTTAFAVTLPNTLNLIDGTVSGSEDVSFTAAALPAEDFTVEPAKYDYIAMNYILVPADKQVVDMVLTANDAAGQSRQVSLTQVPVQRNFRTNIYGALLTNPSVFDVVIDNEFGGDNNHEVAVATTKEELKDALENGGDIIIPEGVTLDMTEFITGGDDNLAVTKPTNLIIDGKLSVNALGRINVESTLNVSGSAASRASGVGNTAGTGEIVTGDNAYGIFNVRGGKLTVRDITIRHTNKLDGSPIALRENVDVLLENVTVVSDFGIINSWAASSGNIVMNNCKFSSTSNSARNGTSWTYAVRILGELTAEMTDCEVDGVQGGISASSGGRLTVNSGTYWTHRLADEPKAANFYAAYSAQNGKIIIKGGNFYAEDGKKAIYNGDNDIAGDPYGCIELFGGRFADQGYDQETGGIIEPTADCMWQAIEGDPIYKWEIVKKK